MIEMSDEKEDQDMMKRQKPKNPPPHRIDNDPKWWLKSVLKQNYIWSDINILRFLRLYKIHPILWNPTNPNYTVIATRRKIFEKIAQMLNLHGIDGNECSKLVESLKPIYVEEKRRLNNSRKCSHKYKQPPKWFYVLDEIVHAALLKKEQEKSSRVSEEIRTTSSTATMPRNWRKRKLYIEDNWTPAHFGRDVAEWFLKPLPEKEELFCTCLPPQPNLETPCVFPMTFEESEYWRENTVFSKTDDSSGSGNITPCKRVPSCASCCLKPIVNEEACGFDIKIPSNLPSSAVTSERKRNKRNGEHSKGQHLKKLIELLDKEERQWVLEKESQGGGNQCRDENIVKPKECNVVDAEEISENVVCGEPRKSLVYCDYDVEFKNDCDVDCTLSCSAHREKNKWVNSSNSTSSGTLPSWPFAISSSSNTLSICGCFKRNTNFDYACLDDAITISEKDDSDHRLDGYVDEILCKKCFAESIADRIVQSKTVCNRDTNSERLDAYCHYKNFDDIYKVKTRVLVKESIREKSEASVVDHFRQPPRPHRRNCKQVNSSNDLFVDMNLERNKGRKIGIDKCKRQSDINIFVEQPLHYSCTEYVEPGLRIAQLVF